MLREGDDYPEWRLEVVDVHVKRSVLFVPECIVTLRRNGRQNRMKDMTIP